MQGHGSSNRGGRNIDMRRRPRMQVVGSGIAPVKSDLVSLHRVLVRISDHLREATDEVGGEEEEVEEAYVETERHLRGMAMLLYRLMLRADKEVGGRAALDQLDLREFNEHFKFLKRLFPFI